jgi:hypothetical protein
VADAVACVGSLGTALLSILTHNCGGRFQSNADPTALVDKGALVSNSPDDVLWGQNRRHANDPKKYARLFSRSSTVAGLAPT